MNRYFFESWRAHFGLLLLYYALVVLPHTEIGVFITGLFENVSRDSYNFVILIASLLLVAGAVLFLKRLNYKELDSIVGFYVLYSILLVFLSFNLLFVVNIEAIHFIQYALLAILLFPLVRSYPITLAWIVLLGLLDEAYQYFYLFPEYKYLDWNDIVIDQIGGGVGLLVVRYLDTPNYKFKPPKKYIRILSAVIILLVIGVTLAYASGFLSTLAEENVPHSLIRVYNPGFWQVIGPDITYHVFTPVSALVLMAVLFLSFMGLVYGSTAYIQEK